MFHSIPIPDDLRFSFFHSSIIKQLSSFFLKQICGWREANKSYSISGESEKVTRWDRLGDWETGVSFKMVSSRIWGTNFYEIRNLWNLFKTCGTDKSQPGTFFQILDKDRIANAKHEIKTIGDIQIVKNFVSAVFIHWIYF